MEKAYECKSQILGMGTNDERHVKVLNKIMSIQEDTGQFMITCEVDSHHAGIIAKEFGLEPAKEVSTLVVKDEMCSRRIRRIA